MGTGADAPVERGLAGRDAASVLGTAGCAGSAAGCAALRARASAGDDVGLMVVHSEDVYLGGTGCQTGGAGLMGAGRKGLGTGLYAGAVGPADVIGAGTGNAGRGAGSPGPDMGLKAGCAEAMKAASAHSDCMQAMSLATGQYNNLE